PTLSPCSTFSYCPLPAILSPPPLHLLPVLLSPPGRPPRPPLFPYTTLFRSMSTDLRPPVLVRCTSNDCLAWPRLPGAAGGTLRRSEEHTSELQSRFDLVCRLLLEKKKKKER